MMDGKREAFMKMWIFVAMYVILLFLPGCVTFEMSKPEGFAEYKVEKNIYRAISSDGIRIKVYQVRNDSQGDVDMWKKSAGHFLKGQGYVEQSRKEIVTVEKKKGVYTEYNHRYYGSSYIYSLTIFADNGELYIVEVAGVKDAYNKKRESILGAIRNIRISR